MIVIVLLKKMPFNFTSQRLHNFEVDIIKQIINTFIILTGVYKRITHDPVLYYVLISHCSLFSMIKHLWIKCRASLSNKISVTWLMSNESSIVYFSGGISYKISKNLCCRPYNLGLLPGQYFHSFLSFTYVYILTQYQCQL